MFCPTCGRDNSVGRKFCASCGTNLEAVTQALSGNADDIFTKTDIALDQFIARYAERVFKEAPSVALDRKVSNSWKVLGQGVLTSLVDLFLFVLMWNIFPLKLFVLLISTPIRLLSERGRYQKSATAELGGERAPELPEPPPRQWLPDSVASVTEQTTIILGDPDPTGRNFQIKTSPPK